MARALCARVVPDGPAVYPTGFLTNFIANPI